MNTIETRIKNLQEEFYYLQEELMLLQKHTNHRSHDLRERIAAKMREIDELEKEIQQFRKEKI